MSLFADDTTIIGTKEELEQDCKVIEEVMTSFEEQNNETKKERLLFGETSSHCIRMLGSWINPKVDVQNRLKKASHPWGKVCPRLVKSKLSKRQKALVVQTCVESGLLFDAAVRPWQKREVNKLHKGWTKDRDTHGAITKNYFQNNAENQLKHSRHKKPLLSKPSE